MNYQYIYFRNIHKNSVSYRITEKYLLGLIKSYTFIAELFEKYSIDYNHQEVIFKKHIGFFTTQILRAYNLDILTFDELNRILNSDSFKDMAKKAIFKNNSEFSEYFKYMFDGKYHDAKKTINNIKLNAEISKSYLTMKNKNNDLKNQNKDLNNQNNDLRNQNNELNDQNNDLKNQNTILTEQNNNVNNKLVELKKDADSIYLENKELVKSNDALKSENSNLKTELNEIKSKRLWKLLNKF